MNIIYGANDNLDIGLIEKIEFLNGFLNGLTTIDGKINQFFSRVFLLESKSNVQINDINNFFKPHAFFEMKKEIYIEDDWNKKFELGIRDCILRHPVGVTDSTDVLNRKRYISFKIMDMIDFMELDKYGDISLNIIEAESENSRSKFFILSFGMFCLVFLFSENN